MFEGQDPDQIIDHHLEDAYEEVVNDFEEHLRDSCPGYEEEVYSVVVDQTSELLKPAVRDAMGIKPQLGGSMSFSVFMNPAEVTLEDSEVEVVRKVNAGLSVADYGIERSGILELGRAAAEFGYEEEDTTWHPDYHPAPGLPPEEDRIFY